MLYEFTQEVNAIRDKNAYKTLFIDRFLVLVANSLCQRYYLLSKYKKNFIQFKQFVLLLVLFLFSRLFLQLRRDAMCGINFQNGRNEQQHHPLVIDILDVVVIPVARTVAE